MTKITPPNVDLGVIKIPHDLEKKVSSTLNSTDQSYWFKKVIMFTDTSIEVTDTSKCGRKRDRDPILNKIRVLEKWTINKGGCSYKRRV